MSTASDDVVVLFDSFSHKVNCRRSHHAEYLDIILDHWRRLTFSGAADLSYSDYSVEVHVVLIYTEEKPHHV